MAKGGFRPGAGRKKASHTIEAEEYRKLLIARVREEAGPIIDALIAKARKGDVQALKEINDRVLGRAHQQVGLDEETISALTFRWLSEK